MYIKMQSDKSLTITIPTTVYRGETNADLITFLLPAVYEEKNIADCSIVMRYVLPDGTGCSDVLDMEPELYKGHCQCTTPINTRLTVQEGKVLLWLTASDHQDGVVIKTGEVIITVRPSRNLYDYLPQGQLDQLDLLDAKVAQLQGTKADDLVYNTEDNSLRLSANGEEIGDVVILEGGGSGEIGAVQRIDGGTAEGA